MSYNNIKVNNEKPDSSGNVTFDLEDVNDISMSSLANNQVLRYNGTNWVNSNESLTKQYLFIGEGASQAYSDSGRTGNVGSHHKVAIYDSNPVNTITGASFTYKDNDSSTNWINEITLPSGKYNAIAQTRFEFSASGYISYNLATSLTNNSAYWLTPLAVIGQNTTTYDGAPATMQGYFELTSTDAIMFKLNIVSNVDTVANQGNMPAEHTYLYIEKVG